MACEQSRVWCRDTAPLCSQVGQALWALSPDRTLDEPLAGGEPAAGRFQEESQDFQILGNNPAHSPPEKERVPGTEPGRAAGLACR